MKQWPSNYSTWQSFPYSFVFAAAHFRRLFPSGTAVLFCYLQTSLFKAFKFTCSWAFPHTKADFRPANFELPIVLSSLEWSPVSASVTTGWKNCFQSDQYPFLLFLNKPRCLRLLLQGSIFRPCTTSISIFWAVCCLILSLCLLQHPLHSSDTKMNTVGWEWCHQS